MIIMKNDWNFAVATANCCAYCERMHNNESNNSTNSNDIQTACRSRDKQIAHSIAQFNSFARASLLKMRDSWCSRPRSFTMFSLYPGSVFYITICKCVKAIALHFCSVAIASHSLCFMMASSVGIMIFFTACIRLLSTILFVNLNMTSALYTRC